MVKISKSNMYDKLRRFWIRWHVITIGNPRKKADWLRKHNVFHYIGQNVNYKSILLPAEPFLIAIHDNVYIAADVRLVTHSLTSTVLIIILKQENFMLHMEKLKFIVMFLLVQEQQLCMV